MILEVRNLERIYQMGSVAVRALDGVTFSLAGGEFCAIMGPSGSGKSTLLHCAGLLDPPTAGNVFYNGMDMTLLPEWQKAETRLFSFGFVFQEYALIPELTALENVLLPAFAAGGRESEARDAASTALAHVGLQDRASHLPRELSGGEQQRVAVARGLVNRPKIIFADEPHANLDSENSRLILELFRTICDQDKISILMVTHEEEDRQYLDRVIRLFDGRIQKEEKTGIT